MAQEVALVTGASSGIGEALARRLAVDGRHLALGARRGDRLIALGDELRARHGVAVHAIPTDLTAPGAVQGLVAELARRDLTVDWLVNNAGFGTYGAFHQLDLERELAEVQLNVTAMVELTRRCLPAMVARERGAVVNLSSVGGFAPGPYMATYCATKAFVLSFSEALAQELRASGVHVLCVCPGFTRTEFQDVIQVDSSGLPGFVWMTAEQVADQAIAAVGRTPVLVNGTMNGIMARVMRFLPSSVTSRFIESFVKSTA
jgi:short-subunit dehydrogenase